MTKSYAIRFFTFIEMGKLSYLSYSLWNGSLAELKMEFDKSVYPVPHPAAYSKLVTSYLCLLTCLLTALRRSSKY